MRNLKTILLATAATAVALAPAMAASHSKRASDGEVKIIYWQAPSILNPYLSGGTKDLESASMVIEPLARYNPDGALVPYLAESIPTLDNGGFAADQKSITWKLKSGLKWSDGSAVTSADAVFTAQYCMHPEGGCAQAAKFSGVSNVEAVDDLTIKISFKDAQPNPYTALVGGQSPLIQAAQFKDCLGAKAPECTSANFGPIGTGPFVVTNFKPNAKAAAAQTLPAVPFLKRVSLTTRGTCNWLLMFLKKWLKAAKVSQFQHSVRLLSVLK